MRIIHALLLIFGISAAQEKFAEHCERDAALGRETLAIAMRRIMEEAVRGRSHKMSTILNEFAQKRAQTQNADSNCPPVVCPSPEPTIFPPPVWPTTGPTTASTNPSTSTASADSSEASLGTAATDSPEASLGTAATSLPTTTKAPAKEELEIPSTFFTSDPDVDPFHVYTEVLKTALHEKSGACDHSSEFKDLNSISEQQLFGFFAQLATVHPGPFCNLCDRFMSAIESKILKPNPLLLTKDEMVVRRMLNTFLPSPSLLCAAVAPGCHQELLASNGTSIKEAELCLECTFCHSLLNILFHRVLLNKPLMQRIEDWFHSHFFFDLCAEWCPHSANITIGGCFDMDKCVSFFDRALKDVVRAVTVILKPERFCVLDLGWCELGEQPNIVHCLRELCEDVLGNTAPFKFVCELIPDRPEEADAFLNVKETKVYKKMKPYHHEYLNQFNDKSEL